MKLLSALLCVFVLAACSNSNSGGGGGGGKSPVGGGGQQNPGQGTPDENKVGSAQPNTGLIGHAWCANGSQQGQDFQVRLNFPNTEDFDAHTYYLQAGRRGPEVANSAVQGNYLINGATITLMSQGESQSFPIRLDPQDATTGAAKLHIGDAAYDPCY